MPRRVALVPILALLLGCDLVVAVRDQGVDAVQSGGERPGGWSSLESSSARLYYQFVDDRGQVRFVESLDAVPEAARPSVGFVKLAVPPPLSPADAARARSGGGPGATAPFGAGDVVLYSAEWCGACRKAKRHLARRGVAYEERDIDQPHWEEELLRRTGERAIPVIDVNGRVLTGFSAQDYDALIGRG